MTSQNKEVVYVDIDDEITSIIDKVRGSSSKIVALVLPKRATVMQSIVNMKLLKRTAGESKKSIVLITSEAALLPLAGIAGIHVAKTLQTKPEIPDAPTFSDKPVSVDDIEADDVSNTSVDPKKSVGELAGLPIAANDDDEIQVDNDDEDDVVPAAAAATGKKLKKVGFNKKLKVPNFNAFRTRLLIGGAVLVLLIVGYVLAFNVFPKATIIIKTDNVNITSSLAMTASVDAKKLDEKQLIVPAEIKQIKKTDSQKVPATGQKDMGTKATGKVTLSLSDCAQDQVTVPAGTQVTSNSNVFITQGDVLLKSVKIGNQCRNDDFKDFSTGSINVTSQNPGGQYNLSARAYAVSGFSNVAGFGSAMTGGTSKVVTVVSQQDIDNAKQKIIDTASTAVKQELDNQLKTGGFMSLADTLTSADPLVTATPNVDTEASEVTVGVTVNFSMTGAKKTDIEKLIENDIKKRIDTKKQKVLSNGLDKATIQVTDKNQKLAKFSVQATGSAGVQQEDAEAIKKAVAGKKKGELQTIVLARPGVKDVQVNYSPFWVYRTPKNPNSLTVIYQQSDGTTSSER